MESKFWTEVSTQGPHRAGLFGDPVGRVGVGEKFQMRTINDAFSAGNNFLEVTRTNITVNNVIFPGQAVQIDGILNHDGASVGLYAATPVTQAAHIVDADGTLADITTKFNALLVAVDADAGVGILAGA